jgi:hypothetical protein
MHVSKWSRIVVVLAALQTLAAPWLRADEPEAADGLIEFASQEGGFSIRLPGKPVYEKTTVGKGKDDIQHQFLVGAAEGVYLVSYQDNPNLTGSSPEQLTAALESGRDRLVETFQGELLESESVELEESHPGLTFRLTLPEANGEANCRFYFVGTRLFQIMAMGVPDFATSEQAAQVLDSFQALP